MAPGPASSSPLEWLINKSSKNDSRAYRNLSMEVIFLCRFFVQTHSQCLNSSIRLRKVLIAADDALMSAAEAGDRTSEVVDEKFGEAIHLLSSLEKDFPSKGLTSDPNIGGTMTREAKLNDKFDSECASTILYALKQNLHAKPMGKCPTWMPTRVVEFHILSSLPDARPIVVYQALSNCPSLQEILWNFCRSEDKKRLTLKENPHFYAKLPTSPELFGDSVKIDPTEDFRRANKFYVLTDKPDFAYIMTDRDLRLFGNLWCAKNAIIFKDIGGRLRGESIVKASLRGTYCGFCERLTVSTVPRASGNRGCGLRPIITQVYPSMVWECLIGCVPMQGSFDFGLCICTGRVEPDSPPLVVPLPPTSEHPGYRVAYKTHIHDLDNDSLLQIFNHCRVKHEDDWNLRLKWRNLVHVCRRWRCLIFDSSSHLDMCLLLMNDSPSIDTLGYLPPLPLVIDYPNLKTVAPKLEDVENIRFGLQQHGHVHRVALRAPSWRLRMWLEPMNKLFPRLEDLFLLSTDTEEMELMLPETLQAPNLRHLALHGIGLSKGLPLLSSAIALSTLSLTHLGASCYFLPGHLIAHLRSLPYLEELSIGFAIPIPLPRNEREPLPPPIPPETLPTLMRLTFCGVDVYLDNLIAQINTPLLERLDLTLSFDLAITLVNLTEFIHRTEGFECLDAQIIFDNDGASIYAGTYEQSGVGQLSLHISCEPLDLLIDPATQVCSALGNVMFAVEGLMLDIDVDGTPSNWERTLDSMLWLELLRPFVRVKKLHIGSSLARKVSQALELDAGGLLPYLQELEVQLEIDDAKKVFSTFVQTRESMGRLVHLSAVPIPHTKPNILVFPKMFRPSFINYRKGVGRLHRNLAMTLISICQNFVYTQEQTFRSYDELRRISQIVDDALRSATKAFGMTWNFVDKKFEKAIDVLRDYERKCYSKKTVARRKARADEKLYGAQMMVDFRIHKSLVDDSPTIVKATLRQHSDLLDVLWMFSRFEDERRRLSLEQNPHFYEALSSSPETYGCEFRMTPIQTFRYEGVSVLIDNPEHAGRVFFETAREVRAFGNAWETNDTIIFKDVCGRLEGESIVWAAIEGIPNLWCFEERPLFLGSGSYPTLSPNGYRPSITATATQITSAEGVLIRDWREPIRRMLKSRDVNIRITDIPPGSSRSDDPAASSSAGSSSSAGTSS